VVAVIGAFLVFSSLYVPVIAATSCFMPSILPDLLLAVASGILSVAWFNLLKPRIAGRPVEP